MPLKKQVVMSKNNSKPENWYHSYKQIFAGDKRKPSVPDAFMKVRYKTPPVQQKPSVIDDKTKDKKREERDMKRKNHDWNRGHFDE